MLSAHPNPHRGAFRLDSISGESEKSGWFAGHGQSESRETELLGFETSRKKGKM